VINGTDVTFVDSTTLTADFDLTGAEKGLYDVVVTNGCGGTPGVGDDMFEVTGGLTLISSGPLPNPLPFPTQKSFCVVGDNSSNLAGVYYFGNNYEVRRYPKDYSTDSVVYMTLQGNYGFTIQTLFGSPDTAAELELDATGGLVAISNATTPTWNPAFQVNQTVCWWSAYNPALANALTLTSSWGTVRNRDVEGEFTPYGRLWHFWGTELDLAGSVEICQTGLSYPYTSGAYSGTWNIDWAPCNETPPSLDGEVEDLECAKLAVDSSPKGIPAAFDIIFYYLESGPDYPAIEVFQNIVSSLGAARVLITTIKGSAFQGTPIDISVLNSYGKIPGAETNWLVVLEDNGGSWQIAVFTQNGALITRYPTPINGTPLEVDVDTTEQKIHVWADDAGTLKYYIFQFV